MKSIPFDIGEILEIKVNVSDDDLREMVRQEFGIDAIKISNEIKEKQDVILKVMKGFGNPEA